MRVSVVVPTYNRAHQIAETIRSVLAQSYPASEVIVIDDGSSDDTESVCASFAPPVRYIRQANGGVSSARNHGASLAKGDLVAFLDSDDIWHRDKLAVQVEALRADPEAGWSITGCDVIDLAGNVVPGQSGFPAVFGVFSDLGIPPDEFFGGYMESRTIARSEARHPAWRGDAYLALFLGNFALPSSSIVRRELFQQVGGFDVEFRLAEETEFFHRLAAAAPVVVLMEPMVGYRVSQAGSLISPTNTRQLILNALTSLDRAAALRPVTAQSSDHERRGRTALLQKLAYANLSLLRRKEARDAVRKGWRAGAPLDLWSASVFAASLVPAPLLQVLHQVKRVVTGPAARP